MIKLERVLLPTDFSDFSSVATSYACAFVEKFAAELHVLHVFQLQAAEGQKRGISGVLSLYAEEARKEEEEKLAKVPDPAWAENNAVVRSTADGTPFVEIVRYAKQNNIDMIVMGTHGHSGLAHVMMGSVAERVVRKSPCPVLTVRPEGHQFVMP